MSTHEYSVIDHFYMHMYSQLHRNFFFSLTNQGLIFLDEILSLLRGVSIRYLFRIHFYGSLIEIYVTTRTYVTMLIYTAIPNFLVGFYHYPTLQIEENKWRPIGKFCFPSRKFESYTKFWLPPIICKYKDKIIKILQSKSI